MRKLLRLAVTVVGLILVLVAVAGLLFASRLDDHLRAVVARHLGYVYGTDVQVEAVRLVPLRQTIEIQGLTIYNPPKFRQGPAMEFGRILVRFDAKGLFSETPLISRVFVEDSEIYLRYELRDGTNLGVLAKNAAQLAAAELAEPAGAASPERGVLRGRPVIQDCVCQRMTVHISTNLVPLTSASMDLAPFTLREVSKGKPVPSTRVAAIFLRSVMIEVLSLKGLLRPVASLLRGEVDELLE